MDGHVRIVGVIHKKYPYRTARLKNWACCVELSDADIFYLKHRLLKDGFDLDNHIVFSTPTCNYFYSDNKLYIGGSVIEENY
jgi:hypothetical protein